MGSRGLCGSSDALDLESLGATCGAVYGGGGTFGYVDDACTTESVAAATESFDPEAEDVFSRELPTT